MRLCPPHASTHNNTLPANAHSIMYAAWPRIAQMADRDIGRKFDKYFTQTLLPKYIAETKPTWPSKVVFDVRGHFAEPHATPRINRHPGGARLSRDIHNHKSTDTEFDVREKRYPICGPKNRFGAVLFLEKEGFAPLLDEVLLAERYDLAIMSTKGMSVTASRELVPELCATHDVPLMVLHDFDINGFTIFGALRNSTQRFTYRREFRVVDLGLRTRRHRGARARRRLCLIAEQDAATLRRHGATRQEIDILVGGERVES